MDPKDLHDEEIDKELGDDFEETNEEENDSENTNLDSDEDESENSSDSDDNEEDEDESSNNYRPSTEEKDDTKATVPLKKHLELKKKLKEALAASESPELNKQSLAEFADDAGLSVETVTKLAKLITSQAIAEATKAAEERVKPIVMEKLSKANSEAFDRDFEKTIVAKYPELAEKKDFLHLKNLEAIKNEFFPSVKEAPKKVIKKDTVEGGSIGGNKEVEKIDFKSLKQNPSQYEKVMKDPVAREKYYAWQEANEANG